MFRSHYDKLPAGYKAQIKVLDFHEIKKHYGSSCPSWLKGFPVVATYESNPTVWEGSKAIELVAGWCAQGQTPPPQGHGAGHGATHGGGHAGGGAAPARQQATDTGEYAPMASSSEVDYGRACAVVSEDLYQSHMPNKTGQAAGVGAGKITSSDIARFNSQRESAKPAHPAGAGYGM